VTTTGRRLTSLLAGLGCGAVIAVLVATTSQPTHPDVIRPDPLAVSAAPVQVAAITQPRPQMAPAIHGRAPALPLLPGPTPPSSHHRGGSSQLRGPTAQVLALTNAQRSKAGCRALSVDATLTRVAQQHSVDMARRSYFSHTAPGGHTWEQRQITSGFSAGRTGGENIARGPNSAREVMTGWMNSPPHRRNILNCGFTTIGIGYTAKGNYWTQDFGY
jgi:uncharacterized protein YkwD